MRRLERAQMGRTLVRETFGPSPKDEDFDYCLGGASNSEVRTAMDILSTHPGVLFVTLIELEPDHKHLRAKLSDTKFKEELQMKLSANISLKSNKNLRHVTRENS
jgi:hypothetical protein